MLGAATLQTPVPKAFEQGSFLSIGNVVLYFITNKKSGMG